MARVAYLGNFSVPYSTESHVAGSLHSLGHEILMIQEGEVKATDIATIVESYVADMFLWTQTYGLAESGGTKDERRAMLTQLRTAGIPTVAFHLDRWWGLDRETQVATEPFFSCDYVFTADGGHDEKWSELDVNHFWLPPGVYHKEAYDGTPKQAYRADVVFVGSWRHYGHEEWWPQRQAMLQTLRNRYGSRFKCFPRRQAIRGTELTDLYASCKVAVGDSCLVGSPERYWSDRVPETLGRGALLVHPYVEGIHQVHPHLPTFPAGDFDALVDKVDGLLANDSVREGLRTVNATNTRDHHTYRNRMEVVMNLVLGGQSGSTS